MRYYRRRRTGTAALSRMIKNVSLKNSEPKVATQLFSSLSDPAHFSLYHNVTHYTLNLLKTTQATTNNPGTQVQSNRIGNELIAKGLKIRMQLINAPTKANVTYKVFVFKHNSDKQLPDFDDSDFWCGPDGTGAPQNRMLDFVDTREVTILKSLIIPTASKTANMNQATTYSNSEHPYILGTAADGSTPGMHSTYRDLWIPLKNMKVRYDANNSPVPKFKDIGIAVVAYDVNNTPQTTRLGYLDFSSRLYFRDP
jgi:hypothetical protein